MAGAQKPELKWQSSEWYDLQPPLKTGSIQSFTHKADGYPDV
jgi:hypothetical protein